MGVRGVPQAVRTGPDFREMVLDIEVWDLKHLNAIITQMRAMSVVSKVERMNG